MIQTTPMIPREQQAAIPPITQIQCRRRTAMVFATLAISVSVIALSLTGCASSALLSPCPNFGASCQKLPVNVGSWSVPAPGAFQ